MSTLRAASRHAPRSTATSPDELADLLAARLEGADLDGVMALYEPSAVLELADGSVAHGRDEIRAYYQGVLAAGPPAPRCRGVQRRPLVRGDLALTGTVLPMDAGPASATCEVARRQPDGTWRWVIDRPRVR